MKKIIEFFKKLFGGKKESTEQYSTSAVRKSSPQPTGTNKSDEVSKPKPKKKYYGKPKQGGSSSGNGRQPYNTK